MKGREALSRCVEALDLPPELVTGEMKVELMAREVYILHHRGLMSYSETEIDVNTTQQIVRVRGEGLQLLAMSEEELRIGGTLLGVELLRG